MSNNGLDTQERRPFDPAIVQDADIVDDTIGGWALSRCIMGLQASPLGPEAAAETASPQQARQILEQVPFLGALRDYLVANTWNRVGLGYGTARTLGVCVAATTIERAAEIHGSYGVEAFAEDLHQRAKELGQTGASEHRQQDSNDILAHAIYVLDPAGRRGLAEDLMHRLARRVQSLPLQDAAREARAHLLRLGAHSGSDAGELYNPWETGLAKGDDPQQVMLQLTGPSAFTLRLTRLFGQYAETDPGLTPRQRYQQGIERTLAYVALGVAKMAGEPLSEAPSD